MFLVLFKDGGSRVSSRFHLCDAIMENNFPWQHRWILPCGENFGMFFTVPNVPIKLVSTFKHRHDIPKIGESKSTAWPLMYAARKSVTKVGSFSFLRGPNRRKS